MAEHRICMFNIYILECDRLDVVQKVVVAVIEIISNSKIAQQVLCGVARPRLG